MIVGTGQDIVNHVTRIGALTILVPSPVVLGSKVHSMEKVTIILFRDSRFSENCQYYQ